mmetsp:Transcript_27443/g.53536  ORF Transcript_27443/g.53536 Transcript_27443/m.53536 type:complete len:236 (-) Transcript_27443:370-1077(-)
MNRDASTLLASASTAPPLAAASPPAWAFAAGLSTRLSCSEVPVTVTSKISSSSSSSFFSRFIQSSSASSSSRNRSALPAIRALNMSLPLLPFILEAAAIASLASATSCFFRSSAFRAFHATNESKVTGVKPPFFLISALSISIFSYRSSSACGPKIASARSISACRFASRYASSADTNSGPSAALAAAAAASSAAFFLAAASSFFLAAGLNSSACSFSAAIFSSFLAARACLICS